MSNQTVIYEPDNSIRKGFIAIFGEIFSELKQNRWLTYQLFRRDFVGIYKQSILGVLWRFITPVISVGTFIVLNRSGIFSIGDIDIPYPLFALIGVSLWGVFSGSIVFGANSLVYASSMITKINFSRKALVIASLSQALVSFIVQLVLIALLFFFYRILPRPEVFLALLVIIPILLFSLGITFVFSLLSSITRDFSTALSRIMTFLMFLTPVLYARPKAGLLGQITEFNPMYYFISAARDLALKGTVIEFQGFVYSTVFAVTVFLFGIFIFHVTETRITERV